MNQSGEPVTLLRDCNAIAIPSGIATILPKDTEVLITQALGNTFTVNDHGRLLRIAGADADALGKTRVTTLQSKPESHLLFEVDLEQVKAQLRTCYDPEIPVNIVDLGLIYHLSCETLLDGRQMVRITMTLTAAGCGMGPVLADDIRQKVLTVPGVDLVDVKVVYDPPWSREMMSDAAKLQLGML
ncbi:putative Fe-S cluster assembly protein SufT [Photobacterium sp. SDRW27]|uniref:putative Fe-S cluster assembly protein SufT n=1 Tax=Photobacterium obscurum TaxID=2829490 RepID=UPI002242C7B2|nr:putative Fe-S cluster assembly protein SufT [Photobacterium obscurum]MCW8331434.1 putative Fe-S cluster assembly protein SufT [Photobacterium obscurum]